MSSKELNIFSLENEDAIDLLANIIEPAALILADKEFEALYEGGKPTLIIVKHVLKNHKKEVVEIVAAMHNQTPETYKFNVITLTKDLITLFNDPSINEVFSMQGQNEIEESSGSVMENTGAKGN